ncbi:glycosyltransferase family A protein [Citrobacter sp. S2-9]|uniref:Glycosyltransferase family A protein n=1 Tax=Citrobacter enshiensis TaxID=2971264 RepID=A0ABT8PTL2_9ENTR|nr:glycosyltransferase family A protein [Citrobacter enshiensis]MDN8599604.1 glycosyltransferase family A protein [Citrobacter enshiensis]
MISIIITVFNRQNTVEAAIESCLSQNFSEYEILIIDDGSTDQSADKIKKYLGKNVKYFYQENQGAAAAKNKGVHEANYEYVTFLDSDDIYFSENTLRNIFVLLKKEPDFICTKNILIRKSDSDIIADNKQISSDVDFYKFMLSSPLNYAGHNPYVFKKTLFLQAGGFDVNSKWGDALIFWRRFFKLNPKFAIVTEPGYIYNQIDNNSVSRKRSPEYYSTALDVMLRCYSENHKDIHLFKVEKSWHLIFMLYAIKSKSLRKVIKMAMLLCSGRFYFIPSAIRYLLETKVMK